MHAANFVQRITLIVHTQMKYNLVFRVINNYPKSWYNYQIAQGISLLGKAVLVGNWSMENVCTVEESWTIRIAVHRQKEILL